MNQPFGSRFRESVASRFVALPYDAVNQTAAVDDLALARLAASDNTLTGTPDDDNDFDE